MALQKEIGTTINTTTIQHKEARQERDQKISKCMKCRIRSQQRIGLQNTNSETIVSHNNDKTIETHG